MSIFAKIFVKGLSAERPCHKDFERKHALQLFASESRLKVRNF